MIANDLGPDRLLRITWYIWPASLRPNFAPLTFRKTSDIPEPLSEIPPPHTGKEMFIKIESDNHKHDV